MRQLKKIPIASLLDVRDATWERFRDYYLDVILPKLRDVTWSAEIMSAVAKGASLKEIIRQTLVATDGVDLKEVPKWLVAGGLRLVAAILRLYTGVPIEIPDEASGAVSIASPAMSRKITAMIIGLSHPPVREFRSKVESVLGNHS